MEIISICSPAFLLIWISRRRGNDSVADGIARLGRLPLGETGGDRVVAQDAVVVSPVATPKFAPAAAGMTASKDVTDSIEKSTSEIIIAVSADEVDRLAEALTLGLKLTAVGRSGASRVTEPAGSQPPAPEKTVRDLKPLGNVHMIETYHGNKRKVLLYAGGAPSKRATNRCGPTVPQINRRRPMTRRNRPFLERQSIADYRDERQLAN